MIRFLIFRFRRRRAISTMIGGLIVLSLVLTALVAMVFVSQQYDQYQQSVNRMGQYNGQQLSEKLVINYPGLARLTSSSISGWGSGCTTTYNCYNITVSNAGDVGVQIVRIYMNSTGPTRSGCTSLCVLNPTLTIASYAFNQANSFVNPGETNHAVAIALPNTITLPSPSPAFPQNTILLATSRGNVFAFQWPFQAQFFGQSSAAFSSGIMKVAYQLMPGHSGGYDSKNEPSFGGSVTSTYCHKEPTYNYPPGPGINGQPGYPSNYAEILPLNGTGNTLYFVNPWVTKTILQSTVNFGGSPNATRMYIYAIVTNTFNSKYTISAGSIDLFWYSANHVDGLLYGVYYGGNFYLPSSVPPIAPGTSYYAIYIINEVKVNNAPPQGGINSAMFWGAASINYGSGSASQTATYFSGTLLLSGLWIRGSC